MAETVRKMVIEMSLDAGGFRKAAQNIKEQIRLINSDIKGVGDDADAKVKLLSEKLEAQNSAVKNFEGAVEQARTNLENAQTAADKLLNAKRLSQLETDLNNAKTAAAATAEELRKLDGIRLQNIGSKIAGIGNQIRSVGRKLSFYLTGPLMALGGKSYNWFKDQESAMISMQKTIDETDTKKYSDVVATFKDMSETEVPASLPELLSLAGSFGAKGVGINNIEKFTKTMVDMGEAADDLDADQAGTALANILNLTERGDFSKVDRAGAAVVELGNNMNATEGEILSFANKLATDATLVKITTAETLALAAGFVSVGIEAEAGGTASGKVMKRMQMASELGSKAFKVFSENAETASMSIREIQLAADDGKWLSGLSEDLGMKKEEVRNLIDSAVLLQQFSDVMQTNPAQFVKDWEQAPADSVLNFFRNLDRINQSGGEEGLLATLSNMGMTEIRLARLVQAAALNPEMFENAMAMSRKAYEENTALAEEAEKRYASTQSQEEMWFNRTQNAGADMGENIAKAIEPAKKAIDDLLKGFGDLDEGTQDTIVKIAGGLMLIGPALLTIGTAVSGVGNIIKLIGTIKTLAPVNAEAASGLFRSLANSPLLQTAAAGAAIYALIEFLNAIPTDIEKITESLADIKINIDENSKNQTLEAIRQVRDEAEKLSGSRTTELEGAAAAVKSGYGTMSLFGEALEYSRLQSEKQIKSASSAYKDDLAKLNIAFKEAEDASDEVRKQTIGQAITKRTAEYDRQVAQAKLDYTKNVSAYVDGMMLAQPEAKAALEKAAQQYDLFALVSQTLTDAKAGKDVGGKWGEIFGQDVIDQYFNGINTYFGNKGSWDFGSIMDNPQRAAEILQEKLLTELSGATKDVSEGTLGYTLLSALMGDEKSWEMLDVSGVTGALDGMIESMDLKGAAEQAKEDGKPIGENITEGIADGITEGTPQVAEKGTEIKDELVKNIRAAFQMHSPSMLMAQIFLGVPQGMALGIQQGAGMAMAAMAALGAQLTAQAAAMAAAISAAFQANLNLSIPNVGMGGGAPGGGRIINNTVTLNGPVNANSLYKIQRGLTDASKRAARGYGKG